MFEKVRDVIVDTLGCEAEAVTMEAALTEDLGLDSSAKEAVAFALLANEYLFGHCGNVCRVTGAAHPVVLGKLSM